MMKVPGLYTALLLSSLGLAGALFVPEELPTLLSFLYTNIPPIFKGVDSRLGVGFRVGPNADFQVQLEVGPQTRTKPVGPDAEATSKKRHVPKYELDTGRAPARKKKVPETPMGWLQSWKDSVGTLSYDEEEMKPNRQPALDYDVVKHLQQLYKEQPSDELMTNSDEESTVLP